MDTVFLVLAACELALFAAVYLLGADYVKKGMAPSGAAAAVAAGAPGAALLVPVTGDNLAMRRALATILAQDYPDLRFVFAVSHEADPAHAAIASMIAGEPRARLVTAGFATACCQKNRNLLAALDAVDPDAAYLAFCDSTHLARPDMVSRLLAPILAGRARLTSSFHQIVPGDGSLPVLAMTWTVLAVHMLQAAPFLSQPWGGAMALSRASFEEFDIARLWKTAVVDDYTLGPRLLRAGIRCLPVAEACQDTPLSGYTLAAWRDWWFRQLQYFKYCQPVVWVLAALGIAALVLPLVLSPLYVLAALAGQASPSMGMAGAGHLAALCLLMAAYRPLVPGRPGLYAFVKAGFAFLGMTAWLYAKTWTTNRMRWRGIAYEVAFGGRVKRVIRRDGNG